MRKLRFRWICLFVPVIAALVLSMPLLSTDAQGFATNTPQPGQLPATTEALATAVPTRGITPAPATPVPVEAFPSPDAPIDNYPLRTWFERDMLDVLFEQIARLDDGGEDARLALQLTAGEFRRRFGDVPSNPSQHEALIRAMLAAPRGSVDIRWLVHPYIAAELNRRPDETSFEYDDFRVDVSPARFNPDETPDALIHILYPADASGEEDVLYEEYLLAQRSPTGAFTLLPQAYDSPAAPFGTIRSVILQRMEDMNRDTLDEVVLVVDDGQVNEHWWILAARNNQAVDLALPGQQIRVGQLIAWQPEGTDPIPALHVYHYQVESEAPDWHCLEQIVVTWAYQANFYRPGIAENTRYEPQNTLGCTLLAAEPLFAMSPEAATTLLEKTIVDYSIDTPGGDRALLTLAMLYVMQGRLDEARAIGQAVAPAGETDTWAAKQSQALLEALGISSNTALDICEALTEASVEPVCDMDAVLGRYLGLADFKTDSDLVEQLEALGFPVVEAVTVSEIGRANRTVVSFNLNNTGWWGFAAQRDGSYTVEKSDSPVGFESAILPQSLLDAPQTAYDALLIRDDPDGTLTILETLEQNNQDVPLSPAARFLKALSFDLAARRNEARAAYYALWTDYPRSLWGQLASRHLERR